MKLDTPPKPQVTQSMIDDVVKLLEDSGAVESSVANHQLARRICCSVLGRVECAKNG